MNTSRYKKNLNEHIMMLFMNRLDTRTNLYMNKLYMGKSTNILCVNMYINMYTINRVWKMSTGKLDIQTYSCMQQSLVYI